MAERSLRQQIIDILTKDEMNAMEISQTVGMSEKEVHLNLEHIIRTLGKEGKRLLISPYVCLGAVIVSKTANACSGTVAVHPGSAKGSGLNF
jgi:hypothetical protein